MQNKKIFLFTGMMRTAANWEIPIAVLKAKLPDFDIIAIDAKGMGEFHNEKSPLSIEKNIEFLRPIFEEKKGEENYILGFSLGGMIASLWTSKYPDDFKGRILVTTSFSHLQGPWHRMFLSVIPEMGITIFSKGLMRERLLYKTICNNQTHRQDLLSKWQKEQALRPVSGLNVLRQAIAGFFFKSKQVSTTMPTLVLGATNDNLVNYQCSTNIVSHLNSDFFRHETAGHDIFNDDPNWVSDKVYDWLEKKKKGPK